MVEVTNKTGIVHPQWSMMEQLKPWDPLLFISVLYLWINMIFFSLLQQAFHLTLNMISPETHKAVSEVIESCRVPWELKRFCTASAFLTYQAAVFSLPGRQLFVMTRFPAAANYIKLTTSLCYSLIEPFLLLFIFGVPCFLSLLVYSFFFFSSLCTILCRLRCLYTKKW